MARTTIEAHYKAAWGQKLYIRGEQFPLSWEKGVEMTWTEGDCWHFSWDKQSTQDCEFKVLLDDKSWSQGGNSWVSKGKTRHFYPFFKDQPGTLETIHYFNTPIIIYLPPSYVQNPFKRYPVLYVHDGQNLFDPKTSFKGQIWSIDKTVERMVREGLMDEIIVVGIWNRGAGRLHDFTPSFDPEFLGIGAGGGADQYAEWIIGDIKPYIDQSYRTLPSKENTGLMGASLGGLVSLHIARKWPHVFAKVASLSSSFWWNKRELIQQITTSQEYLPIKIYLDAGTHDNGLPETHAMYQVLSNCGYTPGKDLFYYVAPRHAHSESYWGERVHLPMRFLFPPNSAN